MPARDPLEVAFVQALLSQNNYSARMPPKQAAELGADLRKSAKAFVQAYDGKTADEEPPTKEKIVLSKIQGDRKR